MILAFRLAANHRAWPRVAATRTSKPALDQICQALWRPLAVLPWAIRNSSILRPDFMAATSQRGRLPRPD